MQESIRIAERMLRDAFGERLVLLPEPLRDGHTSGEDAFTP
jgi:hypothetical protein